MQRRTFLATLMSTPLMIAVLQACGDGPDSDTGEHPVPDESNTSPPRGTGSNATSTKPRSTACVCDATVAADSVNRFGAALYESLARSRPSTNLVFSPASIAVALAMTRAGAAGPTAAEFDAVLHVSDPSLLAESMNSLSAGLDERTKTLAGPDGEPVDVQLSVANSLWGQFELTFVESFLDELATEYGAGVQLVDYQSDPESARRAINTWVSDETEGRIPELLGRGIVTPDTRLTLVNAIYMKAPWLTAFAEYGTALVDFTRLDGSVVEAPTMRISERFRYAAGSGWAAIELPYVGSQISMIIVLPDRGVALSDAVRSLEAAVNALDSRLVQLSLPKFDIETAVELRDLLIAMGMTTAFDPDAADFSGMCADAELYIGAVAHQANITVDEHGTEAAAATAVVAQATSAPVDEPVRLDIDRPFVFAIRDDPTGAIVFLGHVGDPTTP